VVKVEFLKPDFFLKWGIDFFYGIFRKNKMSALDRQNFKYRSGLDTATKEFLAIELKRMQDARSNYVERATAVAQEQSKSLLPGL
jgi:hypothetical protein